MGRGIGALVWCVAVVSLGGCTLSDRARPERSAVCTEIGARCATEDGPIGVCNDTGRTDCAAPPCLACMPQH